MSNVSPGPNPKAPFTTIDLISRAITTLLTAQDEAKRARQRETGANARLLDVQKLLWTWVLGEHPSGHLEQESVGHWKACINELATVLGVDVSPEAVQLARSSVASAERAENDPLCYCEHEKSLHDRGVGLCIGHHRKPLMHPGGKITSDCREFRPKPTALTVRTLENGVVCDDGVPIP